MNAGDLAFDQAGNLYGVEAGGAKDKVLSLN